MILIEQNIIRLIRCYNECTANNVSARRHIHAYVQCTAFYVRTYHVERSDRAGHEKASTKSSAKLEIIRWRIRLSDGEIQVELRWWGEKEEG